MNKKEITELKRQFRPDACTITRICGCYVDAEKNKKLELKEAFLSLPEEEMFKYFDILKKTLSGTIGKNLLNLDFPLQAEAPGQPQDFLRRLRDSKLKDAALLDAFYNKVIEHYIYGENYYIIIVHCAYDIPGRSTDGLELFDASDEVYEYLLCSICPVRLSKAGLCYNAGTNRIEDRIRDWLVELPDRGFLFPAFNDRSCDLHSMLYYSKNPEELQSDFVRELTGCETSLTAREQKQNFCSVISETLGDSCGYEVVKELHERLNGVMDEHKDDPEPVILDKQEVKHLLSLSGAGEEQLSRFEEQYDASIGEHTPLMASNIINTRRFEVKTPNITVQVSPECMDLIETRIVDGKKCLVITVDDSVTVNGIPARTIVSDSAKESRL